LRAACPPPAAVPGFCSEGRVPYSRYGTLCCQAALFPPWQVGRGIMKTAALLPPSRSKPSLSRALRPVASSSQTLGCAGSGLATAAARQRSGGSERGFRTVLHRLLLEGGERGGPKSRCDGQASPATWVPLSRRPSSGQPPCTAGQVPTIGVGPSRHRPGQGSPTQSRCLPSLAGLGGQSSCHGLGTGKMRAFRNPKSLQRNDLCQNNARFSVPA
jgi:hypothetical protein